MHQNCLAIETERQLSRKVGRRGELLRAQLVRRKIVAQSLSRRAHARKPAFYFFLSRRVVRLKTHEPARLFACRAGVKFSFNRLRIARLQRRIT